MTSESKPKVSKLPDANEITLPEPDGDDVEAQYDIESTFEQNA